MQVKSVADADEGCDEPPCNIQLGIGIIMDLGPKSFCLLQIQEFVSRVQSLWLDQKKDG
jgi:hypothetical protein